MAGTDRPGEPRASEPDPPAAATPVGRIRSIVHRLTSEAAELPSEGVLGSFDGATEWLNSQPLSVDALRGRVVLVDFWTYTCINWLRTLPYRRAWAAKYTGNGLVVIGVHTPEFGFERDHENVVARTRSLGVEYPVAVDSDYRIWNAFSNHYWPALYLADANGQIRHHHFGEGEYEMTEMAIQQLLLGAGGQGFDPELVMVEPRGVEVAADWCTLRSPETYLGYLQTTGFASDDAALFDRPHAYVASRRLPLNFWDIDGTWTVARHASVLREGIGRLVFQFHARDVNLVMGPATRGASIRFRVLLDGEPALGAHGTDVDDDGNGILGDQNTYQLIRQPGAIVDRRFEIEFLDPGAEVYCLTFG